MKRSSPWLQKPNHRSFNILIVMLLSLFAVLCLMRTTRSETRSSTGDPWLHSTESLSPRSSALIYRAANKPKDMRRAKEELDQIKAFIEKNAPGAEISIMPDRFSDKEAKEMGLEKLPFTWNDLRIFIRRAPISDRPPKNRRMGTAA